MQHWFVLGSLSVQHLVYELEIEDMLAFAERYVEKDPTYLKQIRTARWNTGLALLGLAIFGGIALKDEVFAMIFGAIAAYYLIWYPSMAKKNFLKQHRELYQAINPSHFGRQELTYDGRHLWTKCEANEATYKVSTLERVGETEGYVFIYITPNQSIVIRKQRIISGNAGALAAELSQAIPPKSL